MNYVYNDENHPEQIYYRSDHWNFAKNGITSYGLSDIKIPSLGFDPKVSQKEVKKYLETVNNTEGIFLETAHPVKFLDVVEKEINETIEIPEQIKAVIGKEKIAKTISNYTELKKILLESK